MGLVDANAVVMSGLVAAPVTVQVFTSSTDNVSIPAGSTRVYIECYGGGGGGGNGASGNAGRGGGGGSGGSMTRAVFSGSSLPGTVDVVIGGGGSAGSTGGNTNVHGSTSGTVLLAACGGWQGENGNTSSSIRGGGAGGTGSKGALNGTNHWKGGLPDIQGATHGDSLGGRGGAGAESTNSYHDGHNAEYGGGGGGGAAYDADGGDGGSSIYGGGGGAGGGSDTGSGEQDGGVGGVWGSYTAGNGTGTAGAGSSNGAGGNGNSRDYGAGDGGGGGGRYDDGTAGGAGGNGGTPGAGGGGGGSAPTVSIINTVPGVSNGGTTNSSSHSFSFTLSEAPGNGTTFDSSDIFVTKGTLSNWTPLSSTSYTADLTVSDPTSDGGVTVHIPAARFDDEDGTENQAATFSMTYSSSTGPQPTIGRHSTGSSTDLEDTTSTCSASSPWCGNTGRSSDNFRINLGQANSTFFESDIQVSPAYAYSSKSLQLDPNVDQAGNQHRMLTITYSQFYEGQIAINIPAGRYQSPAGVDNIAANEYRFVRDLGGPVLSISSPDVQNGGIHVGGGVDFIITSSEPCDLQQSDISVSSNASPYVWSSSADRKTFAFSMTISSPGLVSVSISAGSVADDAGNTNTGASSFIFTNTSVA